MTTNQTLTQESPALEKQIDFIRGARQLVDVKKMDSLFLNTTPDEEKHFGHYAIDRYGWILRNPVKLREPIPAKGALSIWNYEMPDHA